MTYSQRYQVNWRAVLDCGWKWLPQIERLTLLSEKQMLKNSDRYASASGTSIMEQWKDISTTADCT